MILDHLEEQPNPSLPQTGIESLIDMCGCMPEGELKVELQQLIEVHGSMPFDEVKARFLSLFDRMVRPASS